MSTTAITPTISTPSRARRVGRSLKAVSDEMLLARAVGTGRPRR